MVGLMGDLLDPCPDHRRAEGAVFEGEGNVRPGVANIITLAHLEKSYDYDELVAGWMTRLRSYILCSLAVHHI